jgi:uncharacterized protein
MEEKKKGEMTVREAGHLGGEKVKEEKGPAFYKEIGHKGGEKVRELVKKGEESAKK